MHFNYSMMNSTKTKLLIWSLLTGMKATAASSCAAVYRIELGFYNVTVFEGCTTDTNGRFGKVCFGDLDRCSAPEEANSGNYCTVTNEEDMLAWGPTQDSHRGGSRGRLSAVFRNGGELEWHQWIDYP